MIDGESGFQLYEETKKKFWKKFKRIKKAER